VTLAFTAKAFAAGLLIWFALLTMLITVRMLRGDINAGGMLSHDESDSDVKPESVVAMAIFPVVIIAYAVMALQTDVTAAAHPSLPEVPNTLINLLTGGNGLYLAGKLARGT
jgi:hypothetical protein